MSQPVDESAIAAMSGTARWLGALVPPPPPPPVTAALTIPCWYQGCANSETRVADSYLGSGACRRAERAGALAKVRYVGSEWGVVVLLAPMPPGCRVALDA